MKKLFLFAIVALAGTLGLTSMRAADPSDTTTAAAPDNTDRYVDAYLLIREAERAEANSDWAGAKTKYESALKILNDLHANAADWYPNMVEYRIKGCTAKLADVTPKVPAPALAPAPVAPEKPATTEAGTTTEALTPDATAKLRADLANLEMENKTLKDQLAAKPSPASKQPPEVKHLRAQLDKAHSELSDAQNSRKKEIASLENEKRELKSSLTKNNHKIADLTHKLDKTQSELSDAQNSSKKQIADLENARQELKAALDKTNRKIADLNNQIDDLKKRPAPPRILQPEPAAVKPDETPIVKPLKPAPKPTPTTEPPVAAPTQNFGPRPPTPVEPAEPPAAPKPVEQPAPAPQAVVAPEPPPAPAPVQPKPEVQPMAPQPAPEPVHAAPTQNFGPRRSTPEEIPQHLVAEKPIAKPVPTPTPVIVAQPAPAPVKPVPAPAPASEIKTPALELGHAAPTQNFGPRRSTPAETPQQPVVQKTVENPTPAPKSIIVAKPTPSPEAKRTLPQPTPTPAPVKPVTHPTPATESVHVVPTQNFGPRVSTSESAPQPRVVKKAAVKPAAAPEPLVAAKPAPTPATVKPTVMPEAKASALTPTAPPPVHSTPTQNFGPRRSPGEEATAAPVTTTTTAIVPPVKLSHPEVTPGSVVSQELCAESEAARAQAERLKNAQTRVAELERENKELTAQLSSTRANFTTKHAATDGQIADLQKQNASLKSDLAEAKKLAGEESAKTKRLQAEVHDTHEVSRRAAALAEANKRLNEQLTSTQMRIADLQKQMAAKSSTSTASAAELTKVQDELTAARALIERLQATSARVTALEKENAELQAQLAAAPKPAFVQPMTAAQSEEAAKLRAELNAARSQVESTQPLQDRIVALTKENAALKERMVAAPREIAASAPMVARRSNTTPAVSDKNAALLKRLREENSYLRHLLEDYAQQIPELKPRLHKYTQENHP